MKSHEKNKLIAFQGERGAYSEIAGYSFFGLEAETEACKSFSDVFRKVIEGEVSYGVVPIENSIEGSVTQVYDLFLEYDVKVCGELVMRIIHCLIANPNTPLEAIRVIYSHPQALAQCRHFLERSGCEMISTYDTAGSVKMIKERGINHAGSIASEQAARIYKMNILAKDIADVKNNYTRFFVLSQNEAPPSGNDKTSIIFSTDDLAGALHKALGEFAVRGINLTKIESRPTKQKPWEYNFYLDFEGHSKDKVYEEALEGLRKRTVFLKILGSYPKARSIVNPTERLLQN